MSHDIAEVYVLTITVFNERREWQGIVTHVYESKDAAMGAHADWEYSGMNRWWRDTGRFMWWLQKKEVKR